MLKPPLCLIIVHLESSFHEKSSAVGINGLLDSVEFPWYLCSLRVKLKIGDLTLIVLGAVPKVDKNRCECLIFVYRLVEIRGARN